MYKYSTQNKKPPLWSSSFLLYLNIRWREGKDASKMMRGITLFFFVVV